MTRRRKMRADGRAGNGGRFAYVPRVVMESPAWHSLRHSAKAVVIALAAQFHGHNNGDLSAAPKIMAAFGIHGRSTIVEGIRQAEQAGLVVKTRQGGRHRCNLYALTWWRIDECGGKLDWYAKPTRTPSNDWKRFGQQSRVGHLKTRVS